MKRSLFHRLGIFVALLALTGCVTIPPDILRLPLDSLEKRKTETRQYETTDEEKMLSASAGVLQDLGFTISESETKLGLIAAAKDRGAVDSGQVALATAITVLAALGGSYNNSYQQIDKSQRIRASVITRLTEDGKKILVRVTFQRIVWNIAGNISRVETLNDQNLYEGFFQKLSKSIFLEEQKI